MDHLLSAWLCITYSTNADILSYTWLTSWSWNWNNGLNWHSRVWTVQSTSVGFSHASVMALGSLCWDRRSFTLVQIQTYQQISDGLPLDSQTRSRWIWLWLTSDFIYSTTRWLKFLAFRETSGQQLDGLTCNVRWYEIPISLSSTLCFMLISNYCHNMVKHSMSPCWCFHLTQRTTLPEPPAKQRILQADKWTNQKSTKCPCDAKWACW